ncbi:MAG: TetR/AcrR family transcriptional regulator [Actinomycetota bacterium]|nr:TetR/AcrR family transcriptional regulator [Actinomycetota bacterium]MDQ2698889.1 TetR/AcrR family transcriptional regulator [Actinomycetota bacterium]
MPTPERTSRDAIVAAGCDLLETAGLEGLTMQSVAERVGVRAPSLYKRVRNRDELVGLIAQATIDELGARLEMAAAGPPAEARAALRRLARAAREFAHQRPAGFRLIFAPAAGATVARDSLTAASAPLLRVAAWLAGEEHALHAARTFTAWLNGFVSMELAGAFRLGGDVDEAFEFGIERLSDAIA